MPIEIKFGPFTIPCANDQCPKYVDKKCSIWNKPTKDICPEYVNALVKAMNNFSAPILPAGKALRFACTNAVIQAQAAAEQMARMQQLDPSPWIPKGTIVHVNCGHEGVDFPGARIDEIPLLRNTGIEDNNMAFNFKDTPAKKPITLKEALDLSILLWDDLAESGSSNKSSSTHYSKVSNMRADCPMCEYFLDVHQNNGGCTACPLVSCGILDDGLYRKWIGAKSRENRQRAAKDLSQRLKNFRAEKFPTTRPATNEEQLDKVYKELTEVIVKKTDLSEKQIMLTELKDSLLREIKAEKEAKQKKLFLEITHDPWGYKVLRVGYGTSETYEEVARLGEDKEFEALSCEEMLTTYNQWIKDGGLTNREQVNWKGRVYQLSEKGVLGSSDLKRFDDYARIYDFKTALPACNCKDPNIITTEHNGRVVIF